MAAFRQHDVDGVVAALAPDAELVSPIVGRAVFRGEHDLRVLFGVLCSALVDLRWRSVVGDGQVRVLFGRARVAGPVVLEDALLVELAEDGRVQRLTPHLRPWLGATALAARVLPAVLRHPRLARRALRRKPL